jgi:hypothetical protein
MEKELIKESYEGFLIGKALIENYNKICFLTLKNKENLVLLSSLIPNLIENGKNFEIIFLGNLEFNIEQVKQFQPEVLVMLLKGLNKNKIEHFFKEILILLEEKKIDVDLFIDCLITENDLVNKYIKNLEDYEEKLFSYEIDKEKGLFKVLYLGEGKKEEVRRFYLPKFVF